MAFAGGLVVLRAGGRAGAEFASGGHLYIWWWARIFQAPLVESDGANQNSIC
jgi:hypothetical protein